MITISLCMIVKNEEENLERCLASVKDIPDEIIIIDTGSQDQTKKVAEKYTSYIYDFQWNYNFAEARNKSFSYATMEYILWLDADDIILPEDKKKFLQLKQSSSSLNDCIMMGYHLGFDENNNIVTTLQRKRLVRRESSFQWIGVVHEDLHTSSEISYMNSDISIFHNRSLKEYQKRSKTNRNIKIYEKLLAQGNTMSAHDIYHYAQELKNHEQYEKAIQYYQNFLEIPHITIATKLSTYYHLTFCYRALELFEEELDYTLKAFKDEIPQPCFCCQLGDWFVKNNQFAQAIYWYDLALTIPNPVNEIDYKPFRTWYPHEKLAFCYYQIKNYQKSLYHNECLLKYKSDNQDVKNNIKLLQDLLGHI
ncbi:tetratricopeptide repeat-containing glycosyltransferase [Bacillus toyonensis]|uniref:Glycosyl transferase n=1 Tax=Bacillus toyonensis TaxID=155322 RepID=A0A2C4PSS5_9BACI|nr:glycosyltransferase [Bacillus toyonensis]PHD68085.1 glycosyl transferase [Bacillus toyonensis]